jgi:hypothetical protein
MLLFAKLLISQDKGWAPHACIRERNKLIVEGSLSFTYVKLLKIFHVEYFSITS